MFMDNPETQSKYAQNGKIMLVTSILVFLIILLLIFLHVYRPSCFRRRRRHLHHLIRTHSTAALNRSPPSSVLNILPTFTYSSDTHRYLEDCVVCLSEFTDGDKCRVLTNCNHAFHSHCVDPWFRSHSNCPLCRTSVYELGATVQPELTTSFSVEPGLVGFSSFPAPIGCPRKSLDLELVSVVVELENWRWRYTNSDSDSDSGRVTRIRD